MSETILSKQYGDAASHMCRVCAVKNGRRSKVTLFGNSFAAKYFQTFHTIGIRRNEWYEVVYVFRFRFHATANRHLIDDKDELNFLRLHDWMWEII